MSPHYNLSPAVMIYITDIAVLELAAAVIRTATCCTEYVMGEELGATQTQSENLGMLSELTQSRAGLGKYAQNLLNLKMSWHN